MVLSKTASDSDESIHSTFASRYVRTSLPRFKMPENSIPKDAAYQIINDELMLDGNPRTQKQAVGVGTVGSSEAIMLDGLAFKRKWQNTRKAQGLPYDKPNIVTGANVQVCWEKFARYFEVELKEVKLSEGWDTPIHVDAASGGFIAPFIYPELEWDFRLPLVKSINVSGHKYGLVYAGIGWVIWRSKEDLPEELIFHINYLGADQPTFTLNFSKGSSQVIAQYYQLIRLGFEGYRNVMENCHENAMVLKQGLEKTGRFNIVSKDDGVPLVAFSLKDNKRHDEFEVAEMLRRFGWIVPAYTMPADAQHVTVPTEWKEWQEN
ncbi:hypothetical protein Dsin_032640 [Dipteronia sinensis]|uniref:glutamate decarboxylase n=1 Tax=Dipteronia sinensis TaxID=43782 RepID=A0AAE0DR31_9ROSI|nr:hypothetical protein Dsin_032640 [Dipteronia sinensis]